MMKGQYTIVALIATFITVIAFIVMYPILNGFIQAAIPGMDVYTATMLQLVPFFIILSIIMTFVFLVLPVKE